jgi:lipopolysaccharide export system protein LptA
MPRRAELRYLLLVLLWQLALPAFSLPDDRLQSIEITAESAERDEKAGYTVYRGNVILEQGSLHIEADKLTIFHDRVAADRIVAVGTPATMRQRPEINKGLVIASAGRIIYEKSRERVLLREAASIEQDGAVVTGESIDYFMAEQRVRADADLKDGNARVQVIIPAEVIEAESTGGQAQTPDKGSQPESGPVPEPEPEPEPAPKPEPKPGVESGSEPEQGQESQQESEQEPEQAPEQEPNSPAKTTDGEKSGGKAPPNNPEAATNGDSQRP